MSKFSFIDVIYPRGIKCIVCGGELNRDTRYCLCDSCALLKNDVHCEICGRAILEQNRVCDQCKYETYYFTKARAPFVFEGNAALLVRRLKYYDARYLARYMAEFMADSYFSSEFCADIVTYVPIHKSRLKKRGYNQAELLAEAFSRLVNLPCADTLTKTVRTRNMARLNRAERKAEIANTFAVTDPEAVKGKAVLLIDDTLTTGSTASECAKVLRGAGSGEVCVLTFTSSRPLGSLT